MVLRTLDILDRFYTGYDFGLSDFGLFTLDLHRDTIRFFWTFGLVFLLDFGLSYNLFSFA